MAQVTRLDPLIRIREKEAEQTEILLATARAALESARMLLADAERTALRDDRYAGEVTEWLLVETAQWRARAEVQRAQGTVSNAARREDSAREVCTVSQRRLEVVRRAADRKREELGREEEKAERKTLDAAATLMFTLRSA